MAALYVQTGACQVRNPPLVSAPLQRCWPRRTHRLALVAQLDRASDYESEGREFESSPARHFYLFSFASAQSILAHAAGGRSPLRTLRVRSGPAKARHSSSNPIRCREACASGQICAVTRPFLRAKVNKTPPDGESTVTGRAYKRVLRLIRSLF